jgi:hypothetical protein
MRRRVMPTSPPTERRRQFGAVLRQAPGLVASLALGFLSACAAPADVDTPPQKWQDLEVRVETRPSPPAAGMNEFLVIATGERGRPAYDLVVSLRTSEDDPWKQAIQDGQVGVYRRAAELQAVSRTALQVQIRRGAAAGVLRFPFTPAR